MYEQTLVKTVTPIKPNIIKRMNRYNKWEYGYNKEYDIVVISKNGKIGEILEIQNLCIALPPAPKEVQNTDNKMGCQRLSKRIKKYKKYF